MHSGTGRCRWFSFVVVPNNRRKTGKTRGRTFYYYCFLIATIRLISALIFGRIPETLWPCLDLFAGHIEFFCFELIERNRSGGTEMPRGGIVIKIVYTMAAMRSFRYVNVDIDLSSGSSFVGDDISLFTDFFFCLKSTIYRCARIEIESPWPCRVLDHVSRCELRVSAVFFFFAVLHSPPRFRGGILLFIQIIIVYCLYLLFIQINVFVLSNRVPKTSDSAGIDTCVCRVRRTAYYDSTARKRYYKSGTL